jgi:hypothetical protein
VKFRKGNKILYGQDFRVLEGLPSGVDFEVYPQNKDNSLMKLVAPGYGGHPYGNGALYVMRSINIKRANKAWSRLVQGVAKSARKNNPKSKTSQPA